MAQVTPEVQAYHLVEEDGAIREILRLAAMRRHPKLAPTGPPKKENRLRELSSSGKKGSTVAVI